MRNKVWAAIGQTLLTAAVVTVFSLLALALFAVFVRAFAPSDGVITAVNGLLNVSGYSYVALSLSKANACFLREWRQEFFPSY